MMLMTNFNHERFVIAAGASRAARLCYQEAFTYAMERSTFGKKLIQHQIIRMYCAVLCFAVGCCVACAF
jgi:alkylation response protein AidB-like acyl-CoA dehydrogenase